MRAWMLAVAMAAGLTGGPAAAGPFDPVVFVNDRAVTAYEIDQRLRFLTLLNAPGADGATAERALIEDRLKLEAAEALGLTVSEEALAEGLAEFAGRANLSVDDFIAALARGGVEREAYRDFVRAGVAWREVVRAQIAPGVTVRDAEIDQALRREIETPIVTRLLLSEIIIPAPPGREAAAQAAAQAVANSAPSEAAFADAARRLSATPSRARGGRLDWTPVDNLPPALRGILLALRPGQVTQPLTVPGAVVLFLLRDTQGTLRPGATDQVLDYAVLRLPSAAAAAQVAAAVDTCADLQAAGAGATVRQTAPQGAIPGLYAAALASLDADETAVLGATADGSAGADLVMLCTRQPALLAEAEAVATTALPADGVEAAVPDAGALPTRDLTREELFSAKVSKLADAYLAELRADAVIRRP